MSVKNEFSKHANEYQSHNIIQQIIAKSLIRDLDFEAKNILELGCGSGQVYNNIKWKIDSYTAIDFSEEMCKLHPKDKNIQVKCFDFDSENFQNFLKNKKYDVILSSSALQWSKNLSKLVQNLSFCSDKINAVLFTSNTFKTIHQIAQIKSPILSEDEIKSAFSKYFDCEFETLLYKLEFENKKELFSYIKKSGVSGGSSALDFKMAKKLYKEYDLNYLGFEVVFIKAQKK